MVVPGWFFFKHTISEHHCVCSTVHNTEKFRPAEFKECKKKKKHDVPGQWWQLRGTPTGSHHVSSNNHCHHRAELPEDVPKFKRGSCNNKCFYHHTPSTLSLDTRMLKSVLHIYSCQADKENHICSDKWNDWRHICHVLCHWWHVHLSGFQHEQPPFIMRCLIIDSS